MQPVNKAVMVMVWACIKLGHKVVKELTQLLKGLCGTGIENRLSWF